MNYKVTQKSVRDAQTAIGCFMIVVFLVKLVLICLAIYVASHFIGKYW